MERSQLPDLLHKDPHSNEGEVGEIVDKINTRVTAGTSMAQAAKLAEETPGPSLSNKRQRQTTGSDSSDAFYSLGRTSSDSEEVAGGPRTADNDAGGEVRQSDSMTNARIGRKKRKKARGSHEQHMTGEITRTRFEEDWELNGASVVGLARTVAAQDDELNRKNRQLQELSRQLDETKAQWERARTRNVGLIKFLNQQGAKMATLKQTLARAGRNDEQPTDDEISRRFTSLKNGIMQLVRLRSTPADVAGPSGESEDDAADELLELERRKDIAQQLHHDFFDTDILLQIYSTPAASGQSFEKRLREYGCPESLITARRTANIKACTSVSSFGELLDRFVTERCDAFWDDGFSSWAPPLLSVNSPEVQSIYKAAVALLRSAAHLAIYLQGLRVEYKWEQVNRLQSTPTTTRDDEIIGTFGQNPMENHGHELAFVVFGGVVRGDKVTGLLANGNVRLLKNHVVIH